MAQSSGKTCYMYVCMYVIRCVKERGRERDEEREREKDEERLRREIMCVCVV